VITATVENASKYSNIVEVRLICIRNISFYEQEIVEFARGEWKDGDFKITFPKTVDPEYLTKPFQLGKYVPTFSNENVRTVNAHLIGVDKDGQWVDSFFPCIAIDDGFVQSHFVYVNSDVIISGNNEIIETYTSGVELNATITYSMELKKGWNVYYYSKTTATTENKVTMTEKNSTTPISGLKLYGEERLFWDFPVY